ncbi:hypothetical protein FACS1894187_04500 [Synergistales bacterium]|nr:hypothetical protein FACS1894187_04500 [Synergistales bacterium]
MRTMTELKRTLVVGAEFEITDHCRAEAIGEIRRVNHANTQGIYTIIPTNPDGKISKSNGGKGSFLGWSAAKFWRFKENNVVALYSSTEVQTHDTLIVEFRVLDTEERSDD